MTSESERHLRYHTQKMQSRLQEIIDHLREDINRGRAPVEGDRGRGAEWPQKGIQRLREEERERMALMRLGRTASERQKGEKDAIDTRN